MAAAGYRAASLLLLLTTQTFAADAIILDRTHDSRVFSETRHYRIFLPPDYESSNKRYPVIYWFHGYGERYNKGPAHKEYDRGTDYNGDNIANFVARNDVIIVKWDGYNPRTPNEDYPRPYNIGPVETGRQFPLYFPELVAFIDANYRTIADRDHRATAGLSMGGFMSYWIAGKYPGMVSSASNFMGSPEFVVGPRELPVEYRHDEMRNNYRGVRTRLVTGSQDFIQFYHRQMNLLWTMPTHETENFDFDHGTPGMAKTLAFHMKTFASPLPRPEVWSHSDVYPTFSVWDWTVETNRHTPGFTTIENASRTGFRSSVREWLPAGKLLRDVQVKITTARLYKPNTTVELGTQHLVADPEGRLHIELDGGEHTVGISPKTEEPLTYPPTVTTNYRIADHRPFPVYQHAMKIETLTLGEGNADGKANPGEQIAILLPDGKAYRAAELFSADPCVDLTTRISDNWGEYDWVGASAKYTLAKISPTCAGRTIKMRARVLIPNKPNHQIRDATIRIQIAH